jgi:hypothetical protein
MITGKRQSTRRMLAALAVCGLVFAACGSDDDASSDTAGAATADSAAPADASVPAGSTATSAAGGEEGGDAPSDGMAAAQARIDAFRQPVTELPLSEPVAMESGKKLFYVQCGVSACSEIDVGIQAAAEAAGWEYETASHQDTPETVASAFDAAIAAEADVVMTSGNPREWFASQLATLEECRLCSRASRTRSPWRVPTAPSRSPRSP